MSMDVDSISKMLGLVTAVGSGSYAAIQAGISWRERGRDVGRQSRERRMAELRTLLGKLEACQASLNDIFDYQSSLDAHLRLVDLVFGPDETDTRARADRAFEHFREVHRAVQMQLIEPDDLGPWVYWIHRIKTRPVLESYSEACGYDAFISDLANWTKDTKELKLLREKCPWWGKGA